MELEWNGTCESTLAMPPPLGVVLFKGADWGVEGARRGLNTGWLCFVLLFGRPPCILPLVLLHHRRPLLFGFPSHLFFIIALCLSPVLFTKDGRK